jgi:hypothetical protein
VSKVSILSNSPPLEFLIDHDQVEIFKERAGAGCGVAGSQSVFLMTTLA